MEPHHSFIELTRYHENITEYDAEGRFFGRPDQVALDVIIFNGLVVLYARPSRPSAVRTC
jgi:hypothetical protein